MDEAHKESQVVQEDNMKELYTAREVAEILKISVGGLYRLTSKRKIPFIKKPGIGLRFDRGVLEAWIEGGKIETV